MNKKEALREWVGSAGLRQPIRMGEARNAEFRIESMGAGLEDILSLRSKILTAKSISTEADNKESVDNFEALKPAVYSPSKKNVRSILARRLRRGSRGPCGCKADGESCGRRRCKARSNRNNQMRRAA